MAQVIYLRARHPQVSSGRPTTIGVPPRVYSYPFAAAQLDDPLIADAHARPAPTVSRPVPTTHGVPVRHYSYPTVTPQLDDLPLVAASWPRPITAFHPPTGTIGNPKKVLPSVVAPQLDDATLVASYYPPPQVRHGAANSHRPVAIPKITTHPNDPILASESSPAPTVKRGAGNFNRRFTAPVNGRWLDDLHALDQRGAIWLTGRGATTSNTPTIGSTVQVIRQLDDWVVIDQSSVAPRVLRFPGPLPRPLIRVPSQNYVDEWFLMEQAQGTPTLKRGAVNSNRPPTLPVVAQTNDMGALFNDVPSQVLRAVTRRMQPNIWVVPPQDEAVLLAAPDPAIWHGATTHVPVPPNNPVAHLLYVQTHDLGVLFNDVPPQVLHATTRRMQPHIWVVPPQDEAVLLTPPLPTVQAGPTSHVPVPPNSPVAHLLYVQTYDSGAILNDVPPRLVSRAPIPRNKPRPVVVPPQDEAVLFDTRKPQVMTTQYRLSTGWLLMRRRRFTEGLDT